MAARRILPARVAIAFACGALLSLPGTLDQLIVEDYAAIQDLSPLTGFWWRTVGFGTLFIAAYLAGLGTARLGAWWRQRQTDENHEPRCMHRWRRYQRTHRCICKADARNWTPEERRQALRLISGGRHD